MIPSNSGWDKRCDEVRSPIEIVPDASTFSTEANLISGEPTKSRSEEWTRVIAQPRRGSRKRTQFVSVHSQSKNDDGRTGSRFYKPHCFKKLDRFKVNFDWWNCQSFWNINSNFGLWNWLFQDLHLPFSSLNLGGGGGGGSRPTGIHVPANGSGQPLFHLPPSRFLWQKMFFNNSNSSQTSSSSSNGPESLPCQWYGVDDGGFSVKSLNHIKQNSFDSGIHHSDTEYSVKV